MKHAVHRGIWVPYAVGSKKTMENLLTTSPRYIVTGTDLTGNASSINACAFASEITCSQYCSLATAVGLSPGYTAVIWAVGLHATVLLVTIQPF